MLERGGQIRERGKGYTKTLLSRDAIVKEGEAGGRGGMSFLLEACQREESRLDGSERGTRKLSCGK